MLAICSPYLERVVAMWLGNQDLTLELSIVAARRQQPAVRGRVSHKPMDLVDTPNYPVSGERTLSRRQSKVRKGNKAHSGSQEELYQSNSHPSSACKGLLGNRDLIIATGRETRKPTDNPGHELNSDARHQVTPNMRSGASNIYITLNRTVSEDGSFHE